MLEVIKHLFGYCGEGHPSLIYLFTLAPIVAFGGYIKQKIGVLILLVKSYLGQH